MDKTPDKWELWATTSQLPQRCHSVARSISSRHGRCIHGPVGCVNQPQLIRSAAALARLLFLCSVCGGPPEKKKKKQKKFTADFRRTSNIITVACALKLFCEVYGHPTRPHYVQFETGAGQGRSMPS